MVTMVVVVDLPLGHGMIDPCPDDLAPSIHTSENPPDWPPARKNIELYPSLRAIKVVKVIIFFIKRPRHAQDYQVILVESQTLIPHEL